MPYIGVELSESYLAENSRRNVNRRICFSLLDAGNEASPGVINDASQALKR